MASELGFDDFHLYLRPVQFEVAEQKDKTEQRPVFITAILEDDSSVDRYITSLHDPFPRLNLPRDIILYVVS